MVDKRRMNQQNPNVSQSQCGYLRSILIRFSTRPLLGLRQSRLETGNYCCLFPNSVDRKFSNSVVQRPNRLHLQQRRQCVVSQSESAPALKGECTGSISKPHALWEVQEATFFVFQNCDCIFGRPSESISRMYFRLAFLRKLFLVLFEPINTKLCATRKRKGIPGSRSTDDRSPRLLNSHSMPFNYSRKDKLGRESYEYQSDL